MDKQLAGTTRLLLKALIGVLVCLAWAGFLVILLVWRFESPLAYALGLLAGGGLSAAKAVLLSKSLNKAADLESAQAQNMARLQFLLRYVLTLAVVALVVVFRAYIGLGGTALGLLALQLAAYVVSAIEQRRENRRFALHGPPPPLPDEEEEGEDTPPEGIRSWLE